MPKQKLKKWLPTPEKLRESRVVGWFAPFLADPRLWQMNRGALTRAVYIGVLCAFFPLPGQMPLAIAGALLLRANIPMAVALTWITNPLTTIPVFWLAYSVGAFLIGEPMIGIRTVGVIVADFSLWMTGHGVNPFSNHLFSLKAFIVLQYRIVASWQKRLGYNASAPRFHTQKGHKMRDAKDNEPEDFSI